MVRAQTLPFGELLKGYRQAAALTQEELAERAGLSVRGIKALEGGERTRPYRDTIRLLADALQLAGEERSAFEAAARTTFALATTSVTWSPASGGDFLGAPPLGSLVAREEEWNHLLLIIDAATHGSGRLVLLPGEAGVGKTRLAQEVELEARNRGFLVATGRCYEEDHAIPFAPFGQVLATLSAQMPPARWRDLLAHWPALEGLLQDRSDPAADMQNEGRQLGRAVASFLVALSDGRPVALLLDSLQWADEGTLYLLQHLARTTRARPILLLGTYRESEIDGEHRLGSVVRDLMRAGLVERVAVRRLTPEGTAALVKACIGELDGADEFVEFVHRRSKGTPVFIKRMVLALGGRYRLVRQIGAGGMGRVFEAVDTETGQTVAAKIMFARTESDVRARLRFEQEGAILATLEHPNIVRVYGTFLEEHASCIIMELLEGRPLGQMVCAEREDSHEGHPEGTRGTHQRMPLRRVKQLMLQVLDALVCAHDRGIAHRDIKPDNIMVLAGDRVKVTDFGIARLLHPIGVVATMTSTGMTMGTPLYMAPEQIRGEKVDGRADLYAVGAVLYRLVTGRPPFDGDDPLTVVSKHLQEAPVSPRTITPEVPKDWEGVILKALAKDPARRFQSAAEARAAIGALGTEAASARRHSGLWAAVRQSRAGPLLRFAPIVSAIAVLALMAIAGGIYVFSSRPHAAHSSQTRTAASLGAPTPWGWAVESAGGLAAPTSVAVDQHGNVYVANAGNNTVEKFAPTGALLARWGTPGSGSARFDVPSSVAVDRQGHVFVVNGGNHHVQELSPAGRVLSELDPAQLGNTFSGAGFVAVDASDTVYVMFHPGPDPGENELQSLTPGPNGIVNWADVSNLSPLDPTQVQVPSGLALDVRGNVYVADAGTGRIIEMSPYGDTIRQWSLRELADAAARPAGLAVDNTHGVPGNVYVADSTNDRILKLSPDGKLLASWGAKGSGPTRFLHPSGVAIDAQGNVYVASRRGNDIQKLSSRGRLLAEWGTPRLRPARLDNPLSTAVDNHGNVFVVTRSSSSHIQKFAPSGRLLADWGPTSFGRPGTPRVTYAFGSLGVDGQGDLYAADTLNNHVLKLSPRGRLLDEWGAAGDKRLQFGIISGVAVDRRGNVYVGDSRNSRVLKLSRSGKLLARWATGYFFTSQHLAVDGHGNLYVAYAGNALIQKFSPTGRLLLDWGGSGRGQLTDTTGVAVDKQGNVYVVDDGTDRVEEFSSQGELLGGWGTRGSQSGHFLGPSSVAVGGSGDVYVSDTGNHRIQRLAPSR